MPDAFLCDPGLKVPGADSEVCLSVVGRGERRVAGSRRSRWIGHDIRGVRALHPAGRRRILGRDTFERCVDEARKGQWGPATVRRLARIACFDRAALGGLRARRRLFHRFGGVETGAVVNPYRHARFDLRSRHHEFAGPSGLVANDHSIGRVRDRACSKRRRGFGSSGAPRVGVRRIAAASVGMKLDASAAANDEHGRRDGCGKAARRRIRAGEPSQVVGAALASRARSRCIGRELTCRSRRGAGGNGQ